MSNLENERKRSMWKIRVCMGRKLRINKEKGMNVSNDGYEVKDFNVRML